jgi:hypothetical protein
MKQVLGLDVCADIIVGDEMRRGISGGQRKRVTTGGFHCFYFHFEGDYMQIFLVSQIHNGRCTELLEI